MDSGTGPGLFIERRRTDGSTLLVVLSGYLDIEAMPRLAICTDDICSTAVRNIHIEMTCLTSVDDAGFRILATFCRMLQRRGCSLVLFGPRPIVLNLLSQLFLATSGPAEEQEASAAAPPLGHRAGGPAIPLSPVQEHALRQMEFVLSDQEPGLAAMFAAYDRLVGD